MKQKRYLASLLAAAVFASAVSLPALALTPEEGADDELQTIAAGTEQLPPETETDGQSAADGGAAETPSEEDESGDMLPKTESGGIPDAGLTEDNAPDAEQGEDGTPDAEQGEAEDGAEDAAEGNTAQDAQPPVANGLASAPPQPVALFAAYAAQDGAITAWNQLPASIDGETLDLSQLEGENDELRTIEVSGDCTIIGRGLDSDWSVMMLGVQLVLRDGASLTLDNMHISTNNRALRGEPAIRLEPGAEAAIHVASDSMLQAYLSSGCAISIPEGSKLTMDGGALSIQKGSVSGEGTFVMESGALLLNSSGTHVLAKQVLLRGGVVRGKAPSSGCTVGVAGGTVELARGTAENVQVQGNLTATDVEMEMPARLIGDIEMHGGKLTVAGVDGDVTVDGGELIVEPNQFQNGVNGSLTLTNGAKATVLGGTMGAESKLEKFAVAVNGDVTVAPGSKFTAAAAGLKTVGGSISGDTVRGSFAAPDTQQGVRLVLNGDRALTVAIPVGFRSFALTVPDGGASYTAADRLGLNEVATTAQPDTAARLAANQDNTALCWHATGKGVQNFMLDDGKITVTASESGISANYAGLDTAIETGVLTILQDDETTANQIVVGDGVKGLTLELHDLRVAVDRQRNHAIEIGKDAEVTIRLYGKSTLQTAFASCIRLAEGARVTLTGGVLEAANEGVECAVIRVPQGAALTVDGAQLTVTGGGAGIGTDAGFGKGDLAAGRIVLRGGAKVYAKGGNDGAGIGGGAYASGGDVVIEDAEVEAYGGGTAAAIGGGGNMGDNETGGFALGAGRVQIGADAVVYAQGGSGAAAIGRGRNAKAALVADAITVTPGAQVRAVSSGAYFAIDTGAAGTIAEGARVLNVRFAENELPYVKGGSYKIDVLTAAGAAVDSVSLPVIAGNEMGRAFALTLPAGEAAGYLVQNGADGRQNERAQYALLDGDAQFLYLVGAAGMTTRDALKFQTFKLTASKEGEGTISHEGESVLAPRGGQTVTFTPAAGYHVESVMVDGAAVQNPGSSYVFEDVTADHTMLVRFARNSGGGGGGGGGGDDRPNPKPGNPEVDVPDGETPLGPGPEGGLTETDIPDEETPLGGAPEIEIEEAGVPLAEAPQRKRDAAPKTGDRSPIGLLAALLALSSAGLAALRRRGSRL